MYFNDRFCNPQYVNPLYYAQQQERIRQMKQDDEVRKPPTQRETYAKPLKTWTKSTSNKHLGLAFALLLRNTDGVCLLFDSQISVVFHR